MNLDVMNQTNQKIIASFIVVMIVVVVFFAGSALRSTPRVTASKPHAISAPVAASPDVKVAASSNTTVFKDGSYSQSADYDTPGGTESIGVSISIKDGVVTDSTVQNKANNRDSEEYQAAFVQSYKTYVVGKKISDLNLSRISGSSLTSDGFNAAIDMIKTQAHA